MPLSVFRRNAGGQRVLVQIDERGDTVREMPMRERSTPPPPLIDPEMEKDLLDLRAEIEGDEEEDGATPPPPQAAGSVPDPSPRFREVVEKLYDKNAEWAIEQAGYLEEPAELARMDAIERGHPKFEGGRTRVLRAIAERLASLAAQS